MILWELFWTFFQIGAFTFGGGYAMLPLIQSEVASHGWMTDAQLVDFVAVSESTPGPFAVNISTYVGVVTGGPLGAACATLGVVLPSFLIILLVARCFAQFRSSPIVQGGMSGLRPAVVALIASAGLSIVIRGGGVRGADGVFPRRGKPGRGANAWLSRRLGCFSPVPPPSLPEGPSHFHHLPVRPFGRWGRIAGSLLELGGKYSEKKDTFVYCINCHYYCNSCRCSRQWRYEQTRASGAHGSRSTKLGRCFSNI